MDTGYGNTRFTGQCACVCHTHTHTHTCPHGTVSSHHSHSHPASLLPSCPPGPLRVPHGRVLTSAPGCWTSAAFPRLHHPGHSRPICPDLQCPRNRSTSHSVRCPGIGPHPSREGPSMPPTTWFGFPNMRRSPGAGAWLLGSHLRLFTLCLVCLVTCSPALVPVWAGRSVYQPSLRSLPALLLKPLPPSSRLQRSCSRWGHGFCLRICWLV